MYRGGHAFDWRRNFSAKSSAKTGYSRSGGDGRSKGVSNFLRNAVVEGMGAVRRQLNHGVMTGFQRLQNCHRNCPTRKRLFLRRFVERLEEENAPILLIGGVEVSCRKAYKHIYADYLRSAGRSHEASQNRSREAWLVAARFGRGGPDSTAGGAILPQTQKNDGSAHQATARTYDSDSLQQRNRTALRSRRNHSSE